MRSHLRFSALGVALLSLGACSADKQNLANDAGLDADRLKDAGAATTDANVEAAAPGYMPAGYTQEPYLSAAPERKFAAADQVLDASRDYIAVLDTDVGAIVLDLFESDTPITVNSFVFLARHHFYEQIAFHRVIEGFMAQTGDPKSVTGKSTTWGTGNPGYFFGTEFKPNLNFDGPGILGMARADDPNTNGSQFFITFVAYPSLDQQYTVWGKVTEGMDRVMKIVRGEPPATEAATRIREARIGSKAK